MNNILKDIWRNFRVPLMGGLAMFALITLYVTDFDSTNIHWYYISIAIASGGGVGCFIYGAIKFYKR